MTQNDADTPDPLLDADAAEHHEENSQHEEPHEHADDKPEQPQHHDDHAPDAVPTGFATPVMAAAPAPVHAVLSPDQFRKIDDLLKRTGKLSRRLTLLTLLNLVVLGLLGWSWYNDHKTAVDHYIGTVIPAKSDTPSPVPQTVTPAQPAPAAVPTTARAASGPPVRDAANAAAAQKLFDEAKALETEGNLPDAVAKLESIKFGYDSVNWPPGLADELTSARAKMSEKPQGDFFGVH